jgi:dipeptidyl aminopeptidase/acylaminoacyl peptidase
MLSTARTVCLLSLCLLSPVALAGDVLTPHKVARLRSVGAAQISPDGRLVAYTLNVPREAGVDDDGSAWSELHVLDVASGRQRAFITGKVSVRSLAWTPDGSGIAFLAKREGDEQTALYVIPHDGGEARRAASLKTSISAYSFSPDGKRVAVVAEEPADEEREKAQKQGFKQEIYEEDVPFARVWIAQAFETEPEPRRLELEGHVHAVEWSPVDERLAVAVTPTPLVDDSYMRQRVRIVDSADGTLLAKIENPGKMGPFAWSPDGQRIALISALDVHDPSPGRILVADATSGRFEIRLGDYPGHASQLAWSDARSVMFVAGKGVWSEWASLDVTDGSIEAAPIPARGPILLALSLAPQAGAAAFVADSPAHPPELFTLASSDTLPLRRTDSNPWLAEQRLAQQEVVRFEARDGLALEGLLIRPLDEQPGRRYPLILSVHGGPEAHHSNGWLTGYSNPGQMAAARGMAVFYTNYRGSTGRGVEFSKLSQGDPAGKEFDDLVDAVDHLIATGLVDQDKVGVTGGSYGGYATAWCSTYYSDRFAAGVMFVGISNKVSKVGTTDIADEEFYVHALKRVQDDNWDFFLERSPIYHVEKSKTPLLILHGKDDPRVNRGQSMELYRHFKMQQKPVRLVFYPGEGHGNRNAASRLDYNLRALGWLEHYLNGPGGELPPYEVDHSDPEKAAEDSGS